MSVCSIRLQNLASIVSSHIRSLGLLVVPNPGNGDCFAYAIDHASYGFFSAAQVRQHAQSFLVNNPGNFAVRGLSAHEVATVGQNGEELTDRQAKLFALALSTDILILDAPTNLARCIEHGAGEVHYLSHAVCSHTKQNRRNGADNVLRIILYTPDHYEGVCWPQ